MKKLVIAAALILATGVLPSYTKQITIKPTETTIAQAPVSIRKDVGTAD